MRRTEVALLVKVSVVSTDMKININNVFSYIIKQMYLFFFMMDNYLRLF